MLPAWPGKTGDRGRESGGEKPSGAIKEPRRAEQKTGPEDNLPSGPRGGLGPPLSDGRAWGMDPILPGSGRRPQLDWCERPFSFRVGVKITLLITVSCPAPCSTKLSATSKSTSTTVVASDSASIA